MNADTHGNDGRAGLAAACVVGDDRALDGLGRAQGAFGVIRDFLRRPPKRHDAVTDEFVDGAAFRLDARREKFEVVVQEGGDFRRLHVLGQSAEAANIGEHHRHNAFVRIRDVVTGLIHEPQHEGLRDIGFEPAQRRCHCVEGPRGLDARRWRLGW